jgi:hypothetical protein
MGLRFMTKQSAYGRMKLSLFVLCVLLVTATPYSASMGPTEQTHPSPRSFLAETLSRIRSIQQETGLSSFGFEMHGASLQLSEIFADISPFLPPGFRTWNPSGEIGFDLKVTTASSNDPRGTIIDLGLQLKNTAFSIPGSIKTENQLEGSIHLSLEIPGQSGHPTVIQGELRLERGSLSMGPLVLDLERDPLHIRLSGSYNIEHDHFAPLSVRFHMASLGEGRIEANIQNLEDPVGEALLFLGPVADENVFETLVKPFLGHISPTLKEMHVNGETRITASIRGSRSHYSIQGRAELTAGELAMPGQQLHAEGLEIRLPFNLEFPEHERPVSDHGAKGPIDGFIRADRIQLGSHQWRQLTIPVSLSQNALRVGQVHLPLFGGIARLDGAQIENPHRTPREITLGLKFEGLDLSRMTEAVYPSALSFVPPGFLEGDFSEIRVSRDSLMAKGNIALHALGGHIELHNIRGISLSSGSPRLSMGVIVEDLLLDEAALGSFLPAPIMNWKLSSAMVFDVALEKGAVQGSAATAVLVQVKLEGGSFSSPEETKLGEGVQGSARIRLDIPSQPDNRPSLQGDLNLSAGEILWEPFYFDLYQNPLRLRSLGVYDREHHRFSSLDVQFFAPTLGEGTIQTRVENPDDPHREVLLSLGPVSNEKAFELFVKEPFGHVSPILNDIAVSGQTRLTASIRDSHGSYSIQGLLEASSVDLSIPAHQIEAEGLRVQFPTRFRYPESHEPTPNTELNHAMTGFIEAERIRWRSEEWRNVTVPLILREGTLFLPDHVEIPIWDGGVVLEGAKIRDPFGKAREILLGLRVNHLDLSAMAKALAPFSIPGSLEGSLSKIRISPHSLEASGNLTIDTLGGRIDIGNIHGSAPYSRLRKVSMDVTLKDIDLKKTSESLKFGQMGGIIQGSIRDLTLSFGQPEKFELEMHSVRRRGVKQYVNAEAVNNLSILSTGSRYGFSSILLQFFEHFPYAKLGIYCKLENDVFTLRGTIHEDGVEYLIKKGPFRGIDVINQNPQNRIRWKQMIRRLKAISQGEGKVEVTIEK